MRFVLKSATVVMICFLTWLATSALVAQQPPKKSASRDRVMTGKTVQLSPVQLQRAALQPSDKPVAMAGMTAFHVEVANSRALASAKADLMDSRGRNLYVWRLSVMSPTGQVISHHVYEDQVFPMAETGSMEPTISDVIDLPVGKSQIQLSLFAFPPGTDLRIFQDNARAAGYCVLRNVKTVQN